MSTLYLVGMTAWALVSVALVWIGMTLDPPLSIALGLTGAASAAAGLFVLLRLMAR